LKNYLVLTVDIKKSSDLKTDKMNSLIKTISDLISYMNDNFEQVVAAGFTAGDEFQIVMSSPRELLDLIFLLRVKLFVDFRIGIGLGVIENHSNGTPNQMYGPAFNMAREAVNEAKKENMGIYFVCGDQKFSGEINIILSLILLHRDRMTDNQRSIYDLYNYSIRFENLKSQREFAEEIQVSDAMVSKTLKKIGYNVILEGEILIKSLITDFLEMNN